MTLVQGELKLVTDAPDEVSQVWIQAPKERLHGTGMITDGRASEQVKNGVVSFNALPGVAVMVLLVNGIPSLTKKLLVPDKANATLRECIEAVGLADDGTLSELEELALEVARVAAQIASADRLESWASETASAAAQAQLSKDEANNAANRAGGHQSNAEQAESNAKQAEANAKQHEIQAGSYKNATVALAQNASNAAASAADDVREELKVSIQDTVASAAAAKTSETNAALHEEGAKDAAERAEFAATETIQQVEGDFATRNYVDATAEDTRDEAVSEFNKILDSSPRIPILQEIEDYLAVLVDTEGTPTDLAIRSSDGQLAEWVVQRLAPRIEQYLGEGGSGASGSVGNLTRFPVMGGRLAANRVNGDPSNFVFCGSSTTENSDPTGYVSLVVDGMQERYPSTAGAETATQFSTTASWDTIHAEPGIHGYGAGVSGTTSANYLNSTRVARIAALEPTAVLHMIGANDSLFSTQYEQYRQNVESWIDQIDAATTLPTQHILVHTYPRWGQAASGPNPDHYKYPWEGYGQELQKIAAARTNVGFIDNNPAFQAVGVDGSGSDPLDLILPDEVHATARGYRLIADLILEALTNIH